MKRWAMKVVGASNVFFCAFGLVYFFWSWRDRLGFPTELDWVEFIFLVLASLFLIGYGAYLGLRLIKNDESAIPLCSLLFFLDILYLFVIGASWLLVPTTAIGLLAIAESPMAPQIALYYPFVGLLVMLFLQFNKRKQRPSVG